MKDKKREVTIERIAVCESEIGLVLPFSPRTWRRMVAAGRVPRGYKVGRKMLWNVEDLRRWAAMGYPDGETLEKSRG